MDAAALTLRPTALNPIGERGLRQDNHLAQSLATSRPSAVPPASPLTPTAATDSPADANAAPQRVNDPLSTADARAPNQDRSPQASRPAAPAALDEREQAQVQALASRDREVRAHEAAHAAAGGGLAGSPTYSFARGPDGQLYAIGGEVRIDTSAVAGDPQATIDKARTIIQAATAPASPSSQDLRAAAAAQAMLVEAQAELNRSIGASTDTGDAADQVQKTVDDNAEARADSEARAEDRRAQERDQSTTDVQDRVVRAQEALREFAQQLEDLNRRLAKVQQQLLDAGAVTPASAIGENLDVNA